MRFSVTSHPIFTVRNDFKKELISTWFTCLFNSRTHNYYYYTSYNKCVYPITCTLNSINGKRLKIIHIIHKSSALYLIDLLTHHNHVINENKNIIMSKFFLEPLFSFFIRKNWLTSGYTHFDFFENFISTQHFFEDYQ